ncbi:hypothetical protein OAO01_06395 [Oligoflexia bacterium]|nr:hypothetical protein [Oligoflexia bacterium]
MSRLILCFQDISMRSILIHFESRSWDGPAKAEEVDKSETKPDPAPEVKPQAEPKQETVAALQVEEPTNYVERQDPPGMDW